MEIERLKQELEKANYVYDDELITTLYVALKLNRPLLIEGAAGVGKTEIAKVMAAALDRKLIRLQCYEGLDESKTIYEWNYQKQLLAIQLNDGKKDDNTLTRDLFSDEYLLERPLLSSIRSEEPVVLLIDEIDKSDEEFEAFLLELLSDFQVSIPEIGTLKAKTMPFIVLTSNRARPISDALRRRCAYLYIDYPDIDKELAIVRARLPHIDEQLAVQVVSAVQKLRENESILKKPSVAETLDWSEALCALGVRELTPELMRSTVGFVLKNNEDIQTLNDELYGTAEEQAALENRKHSCGHHHSDEHQCDHHHDGSLEDSHHESGQNHDCRHESEECDCSSNEGGYKCDCSHKED